MILPVGWNCRLATSSARTRSSTRRRPDRRGDRRPGHHPGRRAWSADDQALIALADEICGDDCASDVTLPPPVSTARA